MRCAGGYVGCVALSRRLSAGGGWRALRMLQVGVTAADGGDDGSEGAVGAGAADGEAVGAEAADGDMHTHLEAIPVQVRAERASSACADILRGIFQMHACCVRRNETSRPPRSPNVGAVWSCTSNNISCSLQDGAGVHTNETAHALQGVSRAHQRHTSMQ